MNIDEELRKGLQSSPKHIPFWYIYDKQGSECFEKCWSDNTYHYIRAAEKYLLKKHMQEIVNQVPLPVVLVDIGCGNCEKTRMVIDGILDRQATFQFVPIDMSKEFLLETSEAIAKEYRKKIDVQPIATEYADGIGKLGTINGNKFIIWFGGLSNLPYPIQVERMRSLAKAMSKTDRLLLSLDVTQNVDELKQAYMDPSGLMVDFYSNVFLRLNRDYGSKIDTDLLEIGVDLTQTKERNTCSFVTVKATAKVPQSYDIPGLGITVNLEQGERVNISDSVVGESSCKYTIEQIEDLVQSGNQMLLKTWIVFSVVAKMNVDEELRKGLQSRPKHIPFWYLHDKQGSESFEKCWSDNKYHYICATEKYLPKKHKHPQSMFGYWLRKVP